MGQSLGKNPEENRKPKEVGVYTHLQGLSCQQFNTIWNIFINHDDAAIDVTSSTFEDILIEFCHGFDAMEIEIMKEDKSADFTLLTTSDEDKKSIISKYYKRFIEDHESKQEEEAEVVEPRSILEGKMDVFHLLVGLLLLSKLTKKERIKTLYEWFTCFEDETDPGLEEDDFLLPLKTIMNSVMVVTHKNDLTDEEIQVIRDEICQEMEKARALSNMDKENNESAKNGVSVGGSSTGGTKAETKTNVDAKQTVKFHFQDIWRWAESSPIVTSWIKLLGAGQTDYDSDGENESKTNPADEDEEHEHDDEIHNEIKERSDKEHLHMETDGNDDLFASAGGGDEFMAVKPATGTIQHMHKKIKQISGSNGSRNGPARVSSAKYDAHGMLVDEVSFDKENLKNPGKTATESRLDLEWIHGYRGADCRNNLYYVQGDGTTVNEAIYFTAAVGVKINLDVEEKEIPAQQNFAFHHTDDILSMAVYHKPGKPGTTWVATGEIGRTPKICIWTPESMTLLNTLKGFHRRGVNQLAFNNTGQFILSLGVDDQHSLAIYDWEKGTMIHNSKSHKSKVFALGFEHLLNGPDTKFKNIENFYSCGQKHILFWMKKGRGYVSKKGVFNVGKRPSKKAQPILMSIASIQELNDDKEKAKIFVYAGSTKGQIYCWNPGKPSIGEDGKSQWTAEDSKKVKVEPEAKNPFTFKGNFGAVNVLKRINMDGIYRLLAAGKGGFISILDAKGSELTVVMNFSLAEKLIDTKYFAPSFENKVFHSLDSQIRAVDIKYGADKDTFNLIFGTKGSEIYEVGVQNKQLVEGSVKCIMQGHSTGGSKNGAELWGLAIYPTTGKPITNKSYTIKTRRPIYATSGDDNRVRVWNVGHVRNSKFTKHDGPKLIAISEQLDALSRALDWSRDGEKIAVGLGGRVGTRVVGKRSKHDGEVVVFKFELDEKTGFGTLSEFKKLKPHPKDWISDVKYSSSGTLAVGAHDRSIYLYNSKTYEYRAKCKGISSYISHLDFSVDGSVLQSNDGSYELLFWDTKSGKQIKSAPSVANVCWDTFTSTLGWPVQGIWPPGTDGTDINAVDLLPDYDERDGHQGKRKNIYSGILATADDFGKVKLFTSPSTGDKAAGMEYRGHSSHVTNIRFANNIVDENGKVRKARLISTGGEDRSIFQWRYERHDESNHGSHDHDPDEDSENEDYDAKQKINEKPDEATDAFDFGSGGGDEFMAVKPWLGAIKAPSKPPPSDKTAPESDLDLKRVHGYRSFDTRDNVRYAGDYIVYHAAALGIRVEKEGDGKKTIQTYNQDHTDDITCLAVSQCGEYIATGEVGKKPKIVVWKGKDSCKTERVLSGFHKREVSLLAFSQGDKADETCYLASIGQDENHSICIYNYRKGNMVANAKGDKNKVFALEFVYGKFLTNLTIVQCGINHVRVWTMNGRNLASKKVPFAKGVGLDTCLSLSGVKDHMLIGGASGRVYHLFFDKDKNEKQSVKLVKQTGEENKNDAHGPINSIYANYSSNRVATGCVKGIVKVFEAKFDGIDVTLEKKLVINTQWKELEKAFKFNGWNVMKTSYKVSGKKKGKKKVPNKVIPVEEANPQIRSVCLHENGEKLLVGTRGSEVIEFEFDIKDENERGITHTIITRGHFKDEVWGLSIDKAKDSSMYFTCGDDGYIRLWDFEKEKQIENFRLNSLGLKDPVMARSCAISPGEENIPRLLAVGLGGNVGRGKTKHDGKIVVFVYRADILNSQNKQKLVPVIGNLKSSSKPLHDAKGWISDMKFSSSSGQNGNYKGYLAVGSHDRNIYIYETSLNVKEAKEENSSRRGALVELKHKLKGHNSYLTHLDFSVDGKWLQSNCGAYELLFWDVKRGRRQTSAGAMRDVQWETFTCILGWPVQGIWPKCADGTDINAIDLESNKKVIITADDFGKLKMFRYPCIEPGASYGQETGHSSHVTNVRWMNEDRYVVSTGGNDRCVFQWENINPLNDPVTGLAGNRSKNTSSREEHVIQDDEEFADPFADVGDDEGDQSMAVKPWKGQLIAPSDPDAARSGAPTKPRFNLELEYVCGYQAQDPNSRNNLRFSSSGDIIYHTAAIGVVEHLDGTNHYHKNSRQRYFKGHDDDIVCLTTDPTAKFVATGQMQSEHERKVLPAVKIWDADSCREICNLGGFHKRAVTCIAFHPDGKKLMSVGNDDDHSVALWETNSGTWEDGKLLTTARGDKSPVLWAAFTPADTGTLFVTGGVRHIRFWALAGRTLKSKLGSCPKKLNTQICGTYIGSKKTGFRFVSGSAAGWLNIWNTANPKDVKSLGKHENRFLENMAKQEGGAITAISPCYEEDISEGVKTIVCGTKTGKIYVVTVSSEFSDFKQAMEAKWQFTSTNMSIKGQQFESFNPEIRSVCIDLPLNKILVGTKSSEIYIADYEEKANNLKWDLVVAGHYADELWGLAVNPEDPTIFATAGDDKTVRVWKRMVETGHVELMHICKCRDMSRALAWFDGDILIAGLGGRVGRKVITGKRKKRRKKGKKKTDADADDHAGEVDIFNLKNNPNKIIEANSSGYKFDSNHLPKDWVSDVKVNQSKNINNKFVAIAAHDQKVWLYQINENGDAFKFRGYCNKSSAAVTHVDFGSSKDNTIYVRTNDLSEEVLRYKIKKPSKKGIYKNETKLRAVRDVNWQSDTCILEWGTEGIWPQGAASDDINSVCTSNTGNIIVSADDHGHINLFNYPCTTQGASPVVGKGHSSHVMNVRFSHMKGQKAKVEEMKIYSVGGNDRAVFQWKISKMR